MIYVHQSANALPVVNSTTLKLQQIHLRERKRCSDFVRWMRVKTCGEVKTMKFDKIIKTLVTLL